MRCTILAVVVGHTDPNATATTAAATAEQCTVPAPEGGRCSQLPGQSEGPVRWPAASLQ